MINEIPRDLNMYEWLSNNFEKVKPKAYYKYIPLGEKHNISQGDIHHIHSLIMLGNEYDDELIIPEYQRDLVWSLEQKQNLILAILNGNPIGEFLFKKDFKLNSKGQRDTCHVIWSVIDGQQRINAIKEFFIGKFKLPDGEYFTDLSYWNARYFLIDYKVNALSLQEISYEDELNVYYNRNFGGTAHTRDDLDKFLKEKENNNE